MKTTWASFLLLLLISIPMDLTAATPPGAHVCLENPVPLGPGAVLTAPRIMEYVGKYKNGEPVYYVPEADVFYIYDTLFAKKPRVVKASLILHPQRLSNPPVTYSLLGKVQAMDVSCTTTITGGQYENLLAFTVSEPPSGNNGCLRTGQSLSDGKGKCCELAVNEDDIPSTFNVQTLKCDDPALVDFALKKCDDHLNCSEKKGCYKQRVDDMFKYDERLRDVILGQQEEYQRANALSGGLKAVGRACSHSRECSNYSCINNTCTDIKVCRLGAEGETAPPNVNCEPGLGRGANGVCTWAPGAAPYMGMLDEITFENDANAGECGFTIDSNSKFMAEVGMQSLRAMEFMFEKIPEATELGKAAVVDCFQISTKIRENVSSKFFQARKQILIDYNEKIGQVRKDFQTLKDVEAGRPTPDPVLMHGAPVSVQELKTRQTGGYDSLMLMYRRNEIFKDYEEAMLALVSPAADYMLEFKENMQAWKPNDESWKHTSEITVPNHHCGAWYWKRRIGSNDKFYSKTKDRWTTYYDVKIDKEDNRKIFDREGIQKHLSFLHQVDTPEALHLYSKNFALIDPINMGGLGATKMTNFGRDIDTNGEGGDWQAVGDSFLDDYNPFDVLSTTVSATWNTVTSAISNWFVRKKRHARDLNGENNGTLTAIHTHYTERIKQYYADLNKNNMPGFIYEPELTGTEGLNCINAPEQPECARFNEHLINMTDVMFAQFLAYSKHHASNYEFYFNDSNAGRPLLFANYVVSLHNLSLYYNEIAQKRTRQNACIEKLIMNVEDKFDIGDGSGLAGGDTYYDPKLGRGTVDPGTRKGNSASVRQRSSFSKFKANLLASKVSPSGRSGTGSTSLSSSGSSGSVSEASRASAAIAKRAAKIKAINSKIAASGKDLAKREASILKTLSSGAASGAARSNSNSSKTAGSSGGQKATLDVDSKGKEVNAGVGSGALGAENAGAGGPSGQGSYSSFGSTSGSGSDSSSASDSIKDSSGMSNEEKDTMMANLEREKSKYNPNEDDGLFNILSKAYVRNLEKVLTRKKEVKDEP